MQKVALISCVSKKLNIKAPAKDLYTSPLFRLNLAYADRINVNATYVLSAKYGLITLNEEIEPYDLTLNEMPLIQVRMWADNVLGQLRTRCDLQADHFVFLAGQRYRRYLIPFMSFYEVPMCGLSIGRQLQFLKRHLNERPM